MPSNQQHIADLLARVEKLEEQLAQILQQLTQRQQRPHLKKKVS